MAFTKTYPFDTPANYTYDSDLVEISAGAASLRDLIAKYQAETNATCFNNYTTDEDLVWADGSTTGTLAGGATVSGGSLDLTGGSKYCTYVAEDNADSSQTITVRMPLTPGYTGSPASNIALFSISDGSSLDNTIQLLHLATGTLLLQLYDSSGSIISNANLASWAAANQEYEFEINIDVTSGASRVFIDGVQIGSTITATGTRDGSAVTELAIGANYNKGITSDMSVSAIQVFSTVQHTDSYTPTDWSEVPTAQYTTTNPIVTINDTTRMEGLEGFTETSTIAGSDTVKYTLSKGSVQYYYNSGWSVSDGTYAQANTAAEIETNKATFTTENVTVTIRMFLHSDDGATTPSVGTVAFDYDFYGDSADTVDKCIVYAYSVDGEGNPSTETITVTPSSDAVQYKDNILLQKTTITITPNSEGYWEAELVETVNMEGDIFYTFNFGNRSYKKTIPDQDTAIFWELTDA